LRVRRLAPRQFQVSRCSGKASFATSGPGRSIMAAASWCLSNGPKAQARWRQARPVLSSGVRRSAASMTARPIPKRHWRSYGDHPLPSGPEALDEPLAAFPSWYLAHRLRPLRQGADGQRGAHAAPRPADPYHPLQNHQTICSKSHVKPSGGPQSWRPRHRPWHSTIATAFKRPNFLERSNINMLMLVNTLH
jgi:hypothetical protein